MRGKILFEKGKVWTISNILSFSRLIISIFLFLLIVNQNSIGAILLGFVAIITDYADGYFARKRNEISELGKVLDPVADKIAVGLSSIGLHLAYGLPLWVVLVIIGRDLLIFIGSVILIGKMDHVIPSELPGKIAVTIISFLLLSYLFRYDVLKEPLLVLTVIIIIVSFIYYLIKFIRIISY